MLQQTQVGQVKYGTGAQAPFRGGQFGDGIVSELHGRFYEQNFNGNLFSAGATETALSANTITLTATTTPIIGVWNPPTSTVNLVILTAALTVTLQAASSARQGAFVWASSVGNAAITTGAAPFNRKTLQFAGSQAKAFNGGVALTGLTNNLVIFEGADLGGGVAISTTTVTAATVVLTTPTTHNIDGGMIVPPGGVLALLNTQSTTNISVATRLVWEEVAI